MRRSIISFATDANAVGPAGDVIAVSWIIGLPVIVSVALPKNIRVAVPDMVGLPFILTSPVK
jgi:hypothetical protein